jgi:hypothetical protein
MRICKCGDYFPCVFSSYVLSRNLQFVTKCEKRNPKLFFLHNKATNTFCIDHEKNGIVPKCVFRTDILQTKFTTSGCCNISSTYLPSLCSPWISSHQLVLLTYSLGSKVERTKISYEWWGWFSRDTHVVVLRLWAAMQWSVYVSSVCTS